MKIAKTAYNRKQHRWERAAACGRIVRSAKRIGLYGRMYHHFNACWKCQFLHLCDHGGSKRRPDPKTLTQFGFYFSTAEGWPQRFHWKREPGD